MQYDKLHPEGPVFSRLIAGAWRWHAVSAETVERLIAVSLDHGIDTFDHADIYGDYAVEEIFGNAIRKNPAWRNRMKLVTKCGIKLLSQRKPEHRIKHYDTSPQHIVSSIETSLQKLNTDHIDLLLIHRPDPLMDAAAVAETFTQLKEQGKVLYFGVSNFSPAQFDLLQSFLSFPLVTNQIEVSLFRHQSLFNGTLDHLYRHRTSAMAWSPLGGGKFSDSGIMHQVKKLEQQYGATTSQLLFAWLLRHPSKIFPVLGTTKPERIAEGAGATNVGLKMQDWFGMLQWATGTDVP